MSRSNALLGLTAIGLVLSAPAFAQTVLNPQEITGANLQSGTNTLGGAATGITSTAFGNQGNTNSLNQIGNSTSALTPGSATFGFGQSIGEVNATGPAAATTFSQSAGNTISAGSTAAFLSNVNAGLAGGNQSATNAVNSATFNVLGNSSGTLQQAVNNTGASVQSATNQISASATTGNAAINGYGNGQIASNTMNSAAALLPSSGAMIGLDQKIPSTSIAVTNTNSATANVTSSANPALDPSVSNLSQSASYNVNTLATSGGPLTLTNGGSARIGVGAVSGQYADLGLQTISTGNNAMAYTGANATAPGIGSAQISEVTQSTGVTVNSASNVGSSIYGDASSPFTQTQIAGVPTQGRTAAYAGATTSPQANAMIATTTEGNANVTGNALSATNTTASQFNSVNINTASSTGAASGYLSQYSNGGPAALGNTAAAVVGSGGPGLNATGNATVANISQAQNLSANTLSANGGNGLTLQQRATFSGYGGENVQNASTPVGVASLTGAVQQMGSTVNSANLGGAINGAVQQNSAFYVAQFNTNSLTGSGSAATTTGSQSSTSVTNVIR